MAGSIGAVVHFYNESNALPGWLEHVSQWADDVTCINAGPGGSLSNDGSIELCEKWGVRLQFDTIDEGFGVLRTKCIRASRAEWSFIMDADERFLPIAPLLVCHGEESYPDYPRPDLVVRQTGVYDQLELLRSLMTSDVDAVCAARRHWFNHHLDAACQNWLRRPDWQLRIVRNCEHIAYISEVKMHERITDLRTGIEPRFNRATVENGPFYDHFHCFYKAMELVQREHDVAIYNALHENRQPPTLEEFNRLKGILEPSGDCA